MPIRATALTGAAGEYYVASKLSHFGYSVALTRSGSPTIDIMVGNASGTVTLSIQVKTSNFAKRSFTSMPEKNGWLWDVGEKARNLNGENILYAFVDLKGNWELTPDVFLVPSATVQKHYNAEHARHMFGISEVDGSTICNKWNLITDKLGGGLTHLENSASTDPSTSSG